MWVAMAKSRVENKNEGREGKIEGGKGKFEGGEGILGW